MAQLPAPTSVIYHSSRALQELDLEVFQQGLLSCRRGLSSCPSNCACTMVGYMRNENGVEQFQAQRSRVQENLRPCPDPYARVLEVAFFLLLR